MSENQELSEPDQSQHHSYSESDIKGVWVVQKYYQYPPEDKFGEGTDEFNYENTDEEKDSKLYPDQETPEDEDETKNDKKGNRNKFWDVFYSMNLI